MGRNSQIKSLKGRGGNNIDTGRYGKFAKHWEEPPYEPFKYYGGHDDEE